MSRWTERMVMEASLPTQILAPAGPVLPATWTLCPPCYHFTINWPHWSPIFYSSLILSVCLQTSLVPGSALLPPQCFLSTVLCPWCRFSLHEDSKQLSELWLFLPLLSQLESSIHVARGEFSTTVLSSVFIKIFLPEPNTKKGISTRSICIHIHVFSKSFLTSSSQF